MDFSSGLARLGKSCVLGRKNQQNLLKIKYLRLICVRGTQWLSGRMLRDQRAVGLSLTGVTAFCPLARHIKLSLV